MFNQFSINEVNDELIQIYVDDKLIDIDLKQSIVKCDQDKQLEQIVSTVFNQIKTLS